MSETAANVLYITRNGMLEPLGQSQVLGYLRGLSRDYRITLISFEKPADWAEDEAVARVRDDCASHGIHWLPQRFRYRPKVLAPAWSMVVFFWLCLRETRRGRAELIHARGYLPATVAMLVGRLTATPFIFDMRALWPEELITAGRLRRGSILHRAIRWAERTCLRRAAAVVSLTEVAVDHLREVYPQELADQKIAVIPTCADLDRFCPTPSTESPSGNPLTLTLSPAKPGERGLSEPLTCRSAAADANAKPGERGRSEPLTCHSATADANAKPGERGRSEPLTCRSAAANANAKLGERGLSEPLRGRSASFRRGSQCSPRVYGCLGTVLSGWFRLDWLAAFFRAAAERDPEARFEIVTRDDPETVRAAISDPDVLQDRLEIYAKASDQVHEAIRHQTASVMFYAGGQVSELGRSPTRMAEVLGCGVPVVANAGVGDVARIVKSYNVGVLAEDASPESMRYTLDELDCLMQDPDLPDRCRRAAEEVFSLPRGTEAYRGLYREILR